MIENKRKLEKQVNIRLAINWLDIAIKRTKVEMKKHFKDAGKFVRVFKYLSVYRTDMITSIKDVKISML